MSNTISKASLSIDVLKKINSTRDKAIILLVLETGLFVNELISLELSDINLKQKKLLIKGKRKRELSLSSELIEALQTWLKDRPKTKTPYVFLTQKGTPSQLSSRGIDRILRKWGSELNLNFLNFRTLRNASKETATDSAHLNLTNRNFNDDKRKKNIMPENTSRCRKETPGIFMFLIIFLIGFFVKTIGSILFTTNEE